MGCGENLPPDRVERRTLDIRLRNDGHTRVMAALIGIAHLETDRRHGDLKALDAILEDASDVQVIVHIYHRDKEARACCRAKLKVLFASRSDIGAEEAFVVAIEVFESPSCENDIPTNAFVRHHVGHLPNTSTAQL